MSNDIPYTQPNLISNPINKCQISLSVSNFFLLYLSTRHLGFDQRMNFMKSCDLLLSMQVIHSMLIYCEVEIQTQVAVTMGVKWANVSILKFMIISGNVSQRNSEKPIISLMGLIGTKILFQDCINSFHLAISFGIKCCK
jgi:hypothetical protein